MPGRCGRTCGDGVPHACCLRGGLLRERQGCVDCVNTLQMKVLGGAIGATSNPNHGSIFWFCFPIEEPAGDVSSLPLSSSWHPPSSQAASAPARARHSLPAQAVPDSDAAPRPGGSGPHRNVRSMPVAAPARPRRSGGGSGPHPSAPPAQPSETSSSQALSSSPIAPTTTTTTTTSHSPPTGSSFWRSSHSTRRSGQSGTSYGSYNASTPASGLDRLGRPLISSVLDDEVVDEQAADASNGHYDAVAMPHMPGSPRVPGFHIRTPTAMGPSAGVPEVARQLSAPPGAAPLFLSIASDSLLYRPSPANAPVPSRSSRSGSGSGGSTEHSRRDRSRDGRVASAAVTASPAPGLPQTPLPDAPQAALPLLHQPMASPHILSSPHGPIPSLPPLPHPYLLPHPSFLQMPPPASAPWPDFSLALWSHVAHLYGLQLPPGALPPPPMHPADAPPHGYASAPTYLSAPGALWHRPPPYHPGALHSPSSPGSADAYPTGQPLALPGWSLPPVIPVPHIPGGSPLMHASPGLGAWDPVPLAGSSPQPAPTAVGVPILPPAPVGTLNPLHALPGTPASHPSGLSTAQSLLPPMVTASAGPQASPDMSAAAQHAQHALHAQHTHTAGAPPAAHGPTHAIAGAPSMLMPAGPASVALSSRQSRDASVPESYAGSSSVCDSLSAWGQPRSQGGSFDEARGRNRGSIELANSLPHGHTVAAIRQVGFPPPPQAGGSAHAGDGHAAEHTSAGASLLAPVATAALPVPALSGALPPTGASEPQPTKHPGVHYQWHYELSLVPEASHEGTHSSPGGRSWARGRGSAAGSSGGSDTHGGSPAVSAGLSRAGDASLCAVEDPFSRAAQHVSRMSSALKRSSRRGSNASVWTDDGAVAGRSDGSAGSGAAPGVLAESYPGGGPAPNGEGMAVASVSTVHSVHGGWGGSEDGLRSRTASQRSFGDEPGGNTPHDYGIEVRLLPPPFRGFSLSCGKRVQSGETSGSCPV